MSQCCAVSHSLILFCYNSVHFSHPVPLLRAFWKHSAIISWFSQNILRNATKWMNKNRHNPQFWGQMSTTWPQSHCAKNHNVTYFSKCSTVSSGMLTGVRQHSVFSGVLTHSWCNEKGTGNVHSLGFCYTCSKLMGKEHRSWTPSSGQLLKNIQSPPAFLFFLEAEEISLVFVYSTISEPCPPHHHLL